MWHKLTKAAGVQRMRLPDARHSCGTTMHICGVPMAVIAKWLGRAGPAMTARIYAHSQDNALHAAGQTLGAVVTSRDTESVFQDVRTLIIGEMLIYLLEVAEPSPRSRGATARRTTCGRW
jgi:hypothetical protein